MVVISGAVEGLVDEAVVKFLIGEAGASAGHIYGKKGKSYLHASISGYNNAAKFRPWIVLVDLDHDADCAPELCRNWIGVKAAHLCFRVAIRAVESWLLADRESIAQVSFRVTGTCSNKPRTGVESQGQNGRSGCSIPTPKHP